jgi:hypothetical protein
MLNHFRRTHPEVEREPARLSRAEALEWYLRPRDGGVTEPRASNGGAPAG